jgi:hypothetical protein
VFHHGHKGLPGEFLSRGRSIQARSLCYNNRVRDRSGCPIGRFFSTSSPEDRCLQHEPKGLCFMRTTPDRRRPGVETPELVP